MKTGFLFRTAAWGLLGLVVMLSGCAETESVSEKAEEAKKLHQKINAGLQTASVSVVLPPVFEVPHLPEEKPNMDKPSSGQGEPQPQPAVSHILENTPSPNNPASSEKQ